jgi:pyruvate dehydrogenase phosphatase
MIYERTSYDLAYLHDIPGSRCGPEDGPWPRSYQVLEDQDVWRELALLAKPQSVRLESPRGLRADSINFQPCPRTRTQDRYVVQQLNIHGRLWTLTGVFDGHLGDTTVEHVAHHLPIIVGEFLRKGVDEGPFTPALISDLFSQSIVAFDDAIAHDVLDLFPEGLAGLSDKEIRRTINDQHHGGHNYKKARLCMYGTTALVALVDPQHENLWIANVGDCRAVMMTLDASDEWKIERLTTDHNGDNDDEVERVRREHVGEEECVLDRRVLGALAPFRSLGDIPFKQPPEFTRRILYNLFPGFHDTSPWEEFLVRNQTPPYISAVPEITHRHLEPLSPHTPHSRFLILFSDGFTDLCSSLGQQWVLTNWARSMVRKRAAAGAAGGKAASTNMALQLLREALGGEDCFSVSRVLTLDMDVAWIDDTAIVVQDL